MGSVTESWQDEWFAPPEWKRHDIGSKCRAVMTLRRRSDMREVWKGRFRFKPKHAILAEAIGEQAALEFVRLQQPEDMAKRVPGCKLETFHVKGHEHD